MPSKPAWSKLDAIIVGLLLLAATTAMVEAGNRITIDTPDAVEAVEAAPAPVAVCAMAGPTGQIRLMPYNGNIGSAERAWCNE
jgi:hypothetical protein